MKQARRKRRRSQEKRERQDGRVLHHLCEIALEFRRADLRRAQLNPTHRRPRHDHRMDNDIVKPAAEGEKADIRRPKREAEHEARKLPGHQTHYTCGEDIQGDRTKFVEMWSRPGDAKADRHGDPCNHKLGDPLRQDLQHQRPNPSARHRKHDTEHAADRESENRANGQLFDISAIAAALRSATADSVDNTGIGASAQMRFLISTSCSAAAIAGASADIVNPNTSATRQLVRLATVVCK